MQGDLICDIFSQDSSGQQCVAAAFPTWPPTPPPSPEPRPAPHHGGAGSGAPADSMLEAVDISMPVCFQVL